MPTSRLSQEMIAAGRVDRDVNPWRCMIPWPKEEGDPYAPRPGSVRFWLAKAAEQGLDPKAVWDEVLRMNPGGVNRRGYPLPTWEEVQPT